MSTTATTAAILTRMATLLGGPDPKTFTAASNATVTSVVAATGTSFGSTSTTAYNGYWITVVDKNGANTAPEGESKVITAVSGTTFTVPAFSVAVTTSDACILTPLSLPDMLDAINDVVRNLPLPRYLAAGLVVAGDEPTLAGWTDVAGGSPTQTAETTIVLTGAQSISIAYTVNGTAVTSASIPVSAGETLFMYGGFQAPTGSARLQLWDVTNGVELAGCETDEQNWTLGWTQAVSVPSTCENVAVRVKNTTATTTAYLDHAQIIIPGRGYLDLPSSITDASNLNGLMRLRPGQASTGENTYAWQGEFEPVPMKGTMRDYLGVNSHRVDFSYGAPLYYEFRQTNTALSTMIGTVYASTDLQEAIIEGAVAGCFRRMGNSYQEARHNRAYRSLLRSMDIGMPRGTFTPQHRISVPTR